MRSLRPIRGGHSAGVLGRAHQQPAVRQPEEWRPGACRGLDRLRNNPEILPGERERRAAPGKGQGCAIKEKWAQSQVQHQRGEWGAAEDLVESRGKAAASGPGLCVLLSLCFIHELLHLEFGIQWVFSIHLLKD